MTLAPGTRLGPYVIEIPLGAGGMGEVYRARDSRLDRIVAIKVLPAHVRDQPELRERFEREARTVASLNHPHICTLYDIGEAPNPQSPIPNPDPIQFLVMEYLEGETLASRLRKGALPIAQVLRYATEIADALDKAHRQGITHRDVKPGNVMLTKNGSKLLDFGLAKLRPGGAAPALAGISALPTEEGLTAQGTILGTFQYMAPEQLEGKDAGARTDIFAFGAMVYEMATGKKAFRGKTHVSLIGAILKDHPPPISTVEPLTPPSLDHVVSTCLAKDPDERWQSASDVMRELQWIAQAGSRASASLPVTARRTNRERLAWMIAMASMAALIAALAVGSVFYFRRAPADTHVYRSSILSPVGVSVSAGPPPNARFALSPDGRRLAFVARNADGQERLWVQSLDGLSAQPLAGTEGASMPFWSPDSRFIGFYASGKVKRIDATGGPPLTLADTGGRPGATWNRDNVILFATFSGGPGSPIRRVPASGGAPTPATTLNADSGETYHAYPFFLPDGRHFLYLAVGSKTAGPATPNGIYVAGLDSDVRKLLVPGGSEPMYAQGHLLFLREQTLMAQPFDTERLELTGDAVPIAEHVTIGGVSGMAGGVSVSETGVLAYQTGSAQVGGNATPLTQIVWFDRSGKQIGVLGDQARSGELELAPDGRRAAVSVFDPARRTRDIWLFDIARGLRTRFTFDPADEYDSVWSPDGNRVVFNSRRKGHLDLYQKASSGAGAEEELLVDGLDKYPLDWSPDGGFILFSVTAPKTGFDLWVLPLFGERKPLPFLQTPFNEVPGRFSPDGRWIAYVSNESGRSEVYVAPFQGAGGSPSAAAAPGTPGGKWQVSTTGGSEPRWRRDGKEIFYLAPDNKLMSAAVNGAGSALEVGTVRPLFDTRPGGLRSVYDVSADGQRFLVNTLVEEAPAPITLVVNWQAGLKK